MDSLVNKYESSWRYKVMAIGLVAIVAMCSGCDKSNIDLNSGSSESVSSLESVSSGVSDEILNKKSSDSWESIPKESSSISADGNLEYTPGIVEEPQVITLPKITEDTKITINVSDSDTTDPRFDLTRAIRSVIMMITVNPDSIPCSAKLKQQILEQPDLIPQLNDEHEFFVYSFSEVLDSDIISTSVAYYQGSNLATSLIRMNRTPDGAITILDMDKLLVFMSGGAYEA